MKNKILGLLDCHKCEPCDHEAIADDLCLAIEFSVNELIKSYREDLSQTSSSEEYWISQGRIAALKDFLMKENLKLPPEN